MTIATYEKEQEQEEERKNFNGGGISRVKWIGRRRHLTWSIEVEEEEAMN